MPAVQPHTGFVALLDVLGFKELVSRDDHLGYMQMVADLIDEPSVGESLQYVLFSDTVVINTKEGGEESLWKLVRACSALFAALLENQIPMRGAIAHGPFNRSIGNEHGVIVAGRPIVEAYQYELKQNWLGIMLCPSVIRAVPDLVGKCNGSGRLAGEDEAEYFRRLRWPLVLATYGGIPFHVADPFQPQSQEGIAVLPISGAATMFDEVKESQTRVRQALEQMKMVAPDPAAQKKYRETFTFLAHRFDYWQSLTRRAD
jgi:hypothetical protein